MSAEEVMQVQEEVKREETSGDEVKGDEDGSSESSAPAPSTAEEGDCPRFDSIVEICTSPRSSLLISSLS
jgi:hypothetical protein